MDIWPGAHVVLMQAHVVHGSHHLLLLLVAWVLLPGGSSRISTRVTRVLAGAGRKGAVPCAACTGVHKGCVAVVVVRGHLVLVGDAGGQAAPLRGDPAVIDGAQVPVAGLVSDKAASVLALLHRLTRPGCCLVRHHAPVLLRHLGGKAAACGSLLLLVGVAGVGGGQPGLVLCGLLGQSSSSAGAQPHLLLLLLVAPGILLGPVVLVQHLLDFVCIINLVFRCRIHTPKQPVLSLLITRSLACPVLLLPLILGVHGLSCGLAVTLFGPMQYAWSVVHV
mmetsp:Transcript_29207/g.64582  ORF Transcript_29207/g.64582 Transcript_29207/m.64582 type:complete len:278 (+) Transcript_29207:460-1293(+)